MISQCVLGNLGVNLIQPPKMCAGLVEKEQPTDAGTAWGRLVAFKVAAESTTGIQEHHPLCTDLHVEL